jgi:hypothetical protein
VVALHLGQDQLAQHPRMDRLEGVEFGGALAVALLEGPLAAVAVLDRDARELQVDALLLGERDRIT